MDDLIGRVVASTGVDRPAAEKAVGIILQFLLKEGPTEKVRALIERMPGADVAMLASDPSLRSPGMFAVGGIARFQAEWEPVSRTQVGLSRLGRHKVPISGKSEIGESAPTLRAGARTRSSGVGTRMMEAGLSMSQIQAAALETIGFAREKAGEDAVGEIVGAIPGLGQFV